MGYAKAFSTLGCPELDLRAASALAKRHDIGAIELRSLASRMDLPAYFRSTYGRPDELAAAAHGTGIRVASLSTSFALSGGNAAEFDDLLAFVPWAEALGAHWLRVFDGKQAPAGGAESEAAERMRQWNALRTREGWRCDLMVETHHRFLDARSILQFLAAAPGTAILWDTHHTLRHGENPVQTWKAIRPAVVHIHVKDSIEVPSENLPYTYVLPGQGTFPMGALRGALAEDDFRGTVSLEWEKQWHPALPSLDEALVAAARNHWW